MSEQCPVHDICFNEIKEGLSNTNDILNKLINKFDEWARQTAVQQTLIEQLYDKVNELEKKFDRQNQDVIRLDKKMAMTSALISFITTLTILIFQKKIGL